MKDLALDLDGVLRVWDGSAAAAAERSAGLPAGAVRAAAFGANVDAASALGMVAHHFTGTAGLTAQA